MLSSRVHLLGLVVVRVAALVAFPTPRNDDDHALILSCNSSDRTTRLGLDYFCALLELNGARPLDHDITPVLEPAVPLFLLCGECVVLGAALFGRMVSDLPRSRSSPASLVAITSAVAYHVVCLLWYLGRLDVLDVVCAAPLCHAVLTAAVASLYTSVMDVELDRPASPRARIG